MATPTATAKQFSARAKGFINIVAGFTILAMVASFALSFHAQLAVGAALHLPVWLQWTLPLATDIFILSSLGTSLVLHEKGSRAARGQLWAMACWTAVSIGLNVFGAFLQTAGEPEAVRWALLAISVIFPLGVLTSSHGLTKLLVSETTESQEVRATRTKLENHGLPVVVAAGSKPRSLKEQETDRAIVEALSFSLDDEPVSQKELSAKLGVPVSRIARVKKELATAS